MRFGMYTVTKNDLGSFENKLPKYVFDNCGKKGYFTIGALDPDNNLVGVTQFFIGMFKNGEFASYVVYIYVNEEFRGNMAASRMLWKTHNIIRKSGIKKSLVFIGDEPEEKDFFTQNGYLFMRLEEDCISEFLPVKNSGSTLLRATHLIS